jgi:uncharacterized membrane protein
MVMATAGASRIKHARTSHHEPNVSEPERILSMISGGALAVYGLQRRDARGLSLALLGAALVRRGATGRSILYDALGVNTAHESTLADRRRGDELASAAATVDARRAIKIERSTTIDRPRAEVFGVWRDFERLPELVDDLESVTTFGDGRSRWIAKLPGGKTIEWDAELVNEIPGELVAWKTVGDSDIAHAGSVHFRDAPGNRGTEMKIVLDYEPPGGGLSAMLAAFTRLFGQAPDSKIREDLRRFKMRLEAGEVATVDGQTSGR